ncbi:MAG: hypothetical protein KKE86_07375, partial [Planctomycetes bacterium]|nr:hypothetical protein [Planctomycetota bacterium]
FGLSDLFGSLERSEMSQFGSATSDTSCNGFSARKQFFWSRIRHQFQARHFGPHLCMAPANSAKLRIPAQPDGCDDAEMT